MAIPVPNCGGDGLAAGRGWVQGASVMVRRHRARGKGTPCRTGAKGGSRADRWQAALDWNADVEGWAPPKRLAPSTHRRPHSPLVCPVRGRRGLAPRLRSMTLSVDGGGDGTRHEGVRHEAGDLRDHCRRVVVRGHSCSPGRSAGSHCAVGGWRGDIGAIGFTHRSGHRSMAAILRGAHARSIPPFPPPAI